MEKNMENEMETGIICRETGCGLGALCYGYVRAL